MRSKWGPFLANIPRTGGPPDDNIVPLSISLDQIERDIREATNELVRLEVEHEKIAAGYADAAERLRAAQMRLIDRTKHLGIRAEIVDRSGEAA